MGYRISGVLKRYWLQLTRNTIILTEIHFPMKPVFLSLFSLLFILPLSAQDKQGDSIAAEITSLELKKAELSSKTEKLRQQMNEKFTLQQSIRNKIEELELQLKDDRMEMQRLQKKTELTSMEKKRLKMWTDNQKELKKYLEFSYEYAKTLRPKPSKKKSWSLCELCG